MTRFGLLLTGSSFASQSFASALAFAKAALQAGHTLEQIFLYEDAVMAASAATDLPSDEPDVSAQLSEFCQQHAIPLLFCTTAAQKRGVCSDTLVAKAGYTEAGLAEFAMRLGDTDKLVQF